jgi:K+-transporting ATPase ATPase A chain
MSYDFLELFIFTFLLLFLTVPLGVYMATVFQGHKSPVRAPFRWLERLTYRIGGINPNVEMTASIYTKNVIIFNLLGFLAVFFILIFQKYLILNPENFPGTSLHLAFNTAISFVTNTNWQSYAGETTLSYFAQMIALTVQNFLSAGTGLAVLVALTRGITRKNTDTIGNFWQDLTRTVVYILLPLSIVLACILLTQGVIQSLSPYQVITTLDGSTQTIPLGAVASQVAIKELGTNGGGVFNANGAHPFENPTPLTNLLHTLCLIIIPSASIYFYGIMTGMKKHAWIIYLVIFLILAFGYALSLYGEYLYNISMNNNIVLEGKETRLGENPSILWASVTTATANGSVNAMMSSLSPLAGGIGLFHMMIDELIFGGIGVGLCSMIMFILLTVFLSGLMVGRTPEYLGKKIEVKEMQWISVAILTPAALILTGAGITSVLTIVLQGLENSGPHGLSTILYAYTSAAANNGSSFAGFDANTPYYNLSLGLVMLIARLAILIPSLMIAGLLAKKKTTVTTLGTFSTNGSLFAILLFSVIILVGALTFFPALALGPVTEQFLMSEKRFF